VDGEPFAIVGALVGPDARAERAHVLVVAVALELARIEPEPIVAELHEPEPFFAPQLLEPEPFFAPQLLEPEPFFAPQLLEPEPFFEPEPQLLAEPLLGPQPFLGAESLLGPQPFLGAEPFLGPEPIERRRRTPAIDLAAPGLCSARRWRPLDRGCRRRVRSRR
jgi:hypothetical protein